MPPPLIILLAHDSLGPLHRRPAARAAREPARPVASASLREAAGSCGRRVEGGLRELLPDYE